MADNWTRLAELRLQRLVKDLEAAGCEVRIVDLHKWSLANQRVAHQLKRDNCQHTNTHTEASLGEFCSDCGSPV